MHYAAATRDGGHYVKILSKGGADPLAVDNEGRTPDYYRRNTVLDLKLIRDDDQENEILPEEFEDEAPQIDSLQSSDSTSAASSPSESPHLDERDEFDRSSYERFVSERIELLPTTENGLYLARTVAPVLTKALAEVQFFELNCYFS
ncbi:unnamed protein product [Gongylonema pulchrum]|uniref:ANK_REP_REGION domain-containing protein n=1 Tax=Gongylonema pulchrum TaxID=637853 RepID=A0A183DB37_9BILA|nr:unnamed protein product [Gongylonema pulchrum]